MSDNTVTVIDYGLNSLDRDTEKLLHAILNQKAQQVKGHMIANIQGRGTTGSFFDTGATAGSVLAESPNKNTRDIGPTTHYAIYGEMGYTQTHAWGRKMKQPKTHPAIGFAREAIDSVKNSFIDAINRALWQLGRPG